MKAHFAHDIFHLPIIEKVDDEPKLPKVYQTFIYTSDKTVSDANKAPLFKILSKVRVYRTYVGREVAVPILISFLKVAKKVPQVYSAFICPEYPDFVYVESTNISVIVKLFTTIVFESVNATSIVSCFCNIGRFRPYTVGERKFARINSPPYGGDPVEILDVDYDTKKAIIKCYPRLVIPPSTMAQKPRPFSLDLFHDKSQITETRVRVSYHDSMNMFKDGYQYRDSKYVDQFLIQEVKLFSLVTWSAPLNEEELNIFIPIKEQNMIMKKNKNKTNANTKMGELPFEIPPIPQFAENDTNLMIEEKIRIAAAEQKAKNYDLDSYKNKFDQIMQLFPIQVKFPSPESIKKLSSHDKTNLLHVTNQQLDKNHYRLDLLEKFSIEFKEIKIEGNSSQQQNKFNQMKDELDAKISTTLSISHKLLNIVMSIRVQLNVLNESAPKKMDVGSQASCNVLHKTMDSGSQTSLGIRRKRISISHKKSLI